ncbi:hypothetical protein SAMN05444354_110149 [Stigmatella aurantiaca]|uniref:Uncharacterized protein n=1 Tax=Stigmatella aurantiaca TaxID=41 RepID=A0A1H7UR00_STIAU|nr:hypothetical protein SAMN05444354_110149 [Stigmatella aurantiaca]
MGTAIHAIVVRKRMFPPFNQPHSNPRLKARNIVISWLANKR